MNGRSSEIISLNEALSLTWPLKHFWNSGILAISSVIITEMIWLSPGWQSRLQPLSRITGTPSSERDRPS